MGISSTLGWESTMNPSPDVLLDHMAWRSLSDHQLVLKLAELVVSDERRSVIFMRRWFGESPLYKGKFQELKNAIAAIMLFHGLAHRPKIVDQVISRIHRSDWGN